MLSSFSSVLARTITQWRWWFLVSGVLVIFIGATYGVNVFGKLKSGGLTDPAADSSKAALQIDRAFPDARVSLVVLLKSETETVEGKGFRKSAVTLLNSLRADPAVQSVLSFYGTQDAHFVSQDRHETYFLIALRGEVPAQSNAYNRLRSSLPKTDLHVTFGGPVVADAEINAQIGIDIPRAELVSFPLLLILLAIIFRSVVAALLPLIIGTISILGALSLTRVAASLTDISVFAANIISLLGLGLAIDYSLLFVSRYRDELALGASVPMALQTTLRTAGESIFFSGLTVILSLLGLGAFPESFLRSMGLGGALAVLVAMLASLTILPALLAILGPKINGGALPLLRRQEMSERFWRGLSGLVLARPVPVLLGALGLLLILGTPFLYVRFQNAGAEVLPETFQSRRSYEVLKRDFSLSQTAPIQIFATGPKSPLDQLDDYGAYVAALKQLPGVQDVHSLVTVDARIPAEDYSFFYEMPEANDAKQHFISHNSTLLSVEYTGDSQSQTAQRLVTAIRKTPPPAGARVVVGGTTAELMDHLASLRSHMAVAGAVIMGATFVLLFLLLSNLVIPLTALVLNTLSLVASFGLMTWIFQFGHGEALLQFTSNGSLDAILPVLIFAIAFGLATDYEVFLVSRIKEEYERTGDNAQAIAIGMEKTGEIITSAALLLIVVVAAFGASRILLMKEMGVGLALAIAIDAALVRTLLVPATLRLIGGFKRRQSAK